MALLVCSLCALGFSYIIERLGSPDSPLAEFYVASLSYTLAQVALIFLSAAALFSLYAFSARARNNIERVVEKIGRYLRATSLRNYALIAHAAAAVVLFVLNAPGILNATFMIDDYLMYSIATTHSTWELMWTPVNEHVIPLFWLELKALFMLIGPHPVPLNLLLFAPAIVVVGGAATLMRMLRFGPSTLFVLLVTFASSMIVSHQLYGFYAIAPYMQVLAVFMLSLIAYVT